MSDAMVCANIGRKGRRVRTRVGLVLVAVTAAVVAAGVALGWPWSARLVAALPAMGAALLLLQVRRNVCVKNAASGLVEDDEMRLSKVPAELDRAARRVAATIWRDAVLLGLVLGAASAASVFLRR